MCTLSMCGVSICTICIRSECAYVYFFVCACVCGNHHFMLINSLMQFDSKSFSTDESHVKCDEMRFKLTQCLMRNLGITHISIIFVLYLYENIFGALIESTLFLVEMKFSQCCLRSIANIYAN